MRATPSLPDWIRAFRHPGYTSIFELLPDERKLYCTEGLLGDWNGQVLLLAKDAMPVHVAQDRLAAGETNPWRHGVRGQDPMGWKTNERVLELDTALSGTSLYGSALAHLMKDGSNTSGALSGTGSGPLRKHIESVLGFVVKAMPNLRAIVCLGNDAWGLAAAMGSVPDPANHPRGPAAVCEIAGKRISLFRLYHPSRAFRGGWEARRAEWRIVADALGSGTAAMAAQARVPAGGRTSDDVKPTGGCNSGSKPKAVEPQEQWRASTELTKGRREGVLNQIRMIGLAAEVRAAGEVARAGWWLTHGATFFDRDASQSREYDLAAHLPPVLLGPPFDTDLTTLLTLAIEVKVSRHTPWIIVRGAEDVIGPVPDYTPLYKTFSLRDAASVLREEMKLREHPLYTPALDSELWHGSHVVEFPAKGRGGGRRSQGKKPSFSAQVTACKAAQDLLKSEHDRRDPTIMKSLTMAYSNDLLVVTKPVVVLDGCLLSYSMASDGTESIEKIPAGTVHFTFGTEEYERRVYRVDVITIDFLAEYMQRMTQLGRWLHRVHTKGGAVR